MRHLMVGLLLVVTAQAHAYDRVSVTEHAILYDANSLKAKKQYVVMRYTPLERVVVLANWVKVRDASGKLYWIQKQYLDDKRYVQVQTKTALIRKSASEAGEVMFRATQDVALEWLENQPRGWVRVRHASGESGYVKATEVWGE